MRRKTVSGIMLTLLLIGTLILTFNIQPVKASGTIYIKDDGSIVPPTANITSTNNVTYYFTGNINESIVVERDNIVIDGAGYTVQGTGAWGSKGIDLSGRSNVTIMNMEIRTFFFGIYLNLSYNNTISGNNITANNLNGINLDDSSNNTISGNNITANNDAGISLTDSSNNTISGNNITNNDAGIYLVLSSNNTMSGNNITANNGFGIFLSDSSNNTLRNNDASNNKYNFGVSCSLLSHYIQDIDDSNTVNGKPVYYWVNRQDMSVPLDVGWIALINCTRITVKNSELINNLHGVLLAYTTNSTIAKNNITNNGPGIFLSESSNNIISGNNITNNWGGIWLPYSNHNVISGNRITNNEYGIDLYGSSNNAISGNSITKNSEYGIRLCGSKNIISGNSITENNGFGIWLIWSSNNKFYHNNFINNIQQVYIETPGYTNFWDDGYPSGGNYWSNHVCTGNPSDGSQPYTIDVDNIDHYPFQDPNGWLLHQLTVTSSPMTGITFTIDGLSRTTPYTEWLLEGSYTLIMPETHAGYVWSHWLEDGDTNRIKTILLQGTTWTAVYTPPKPVGGKAVPIDKPIVKPELPTPWIWLSTIILSMVATVVYLKKRKRNREINS